MKPKFSKWASWSERNKLDGIKYPGVYALAVSEIDLSNKKYSVRKEIECFGMTNSIGGLKSRLKQFDNTIIGKSGHGGAADRKSTRLNSSHLKLSRMPSSA